ncbi:MULTISPECIES: hypothetical protein [Kordiimonas]|jgi:elongation factor Tu|uniref:Elongation factor Tu n=1 Tax=Kordiimonas lacus TaxID=637679 RepID=A0A1G6XRD4_9PROT|nr:MULTISPECIES: hypothetical protein [Kordiimonas]SDD80313.1 elongation factor Tu [Kordiimonas lacus]
MDDFSAYGLPHIKAEVNFLRTDDGGKNCPVRSGYRPNHLVKDDYLTSGTHQYLDKEWVYPGETACANIWFIMPEVYPHTMWPGRIFNLQEASRVVGTVKVLEVYEETLKAIP